MISLNDVMEKLKNHVGCIIGDYCIRKNGKLYKVYNMETLKNYYTGYYLENAYDIVCDIIASH